MIVLILPPLFALALTAILIVYAVRAFRERNLFGGALATFCAVGVFAIGTAMGIVAAVGLSQA